MTVKLRGQINNSDGSPLSGATAEAFLDGQSASAATVNTNTNGYYEFNLPDGKYDVKITTGGNVYYVRWDGAYLVDSLVVFVGFQFPRMTSTERDALNLGATDAGRTIHNTTTNKLNTWNGTGWLLIPAEGAGASGGFDLHEDVATEMTAPAAADRILTSDESVSGDPNRWLSLSRLATWLASNLSLAASRITSGVFSAARLGSGTANATKILYGDSTWKDAPSAGGGNFDVHDDVTTEMTSPSGSDRLVASNESEAGDPQQFLSLFSLTTWLTNVLSLDASKITGGILAAARIPNLAATKITSGVLAAARIPGLAATKITSGIFPLARGGTNASTAAGARTNLGLGSMATRNITVSTSDPSGVPADGDLWVKVSS